jgi:hypothetical protein
MTDRATTKISCALVLDIENERTDGGLLFTVGVKGAAFDSLKQLVGSDLEALADSPEEQG